MKKTKKIQLTNNRENVQIKKMVNKTLGRKKIMEKRHNRETVINVKNGRKYRKKNPKVKREKKEL